MIDFKNYRPAADLLKDRVILVTGSGGGVGRAAALAFAAHGATVILHGREVAKLEAVYDAIVDIGGAEPTILPLDLAQAKDRDFENMALAIESQLQHLDGILHNAAFATEPAALDNQRLEEWMSSMRVNLVAPFALTRACTYLLRAAPDASVILTSATYALEPAAYWGHHAVSKSALTALAKIQADEWESYPNLRINVLVPGSVDSPQRRRTHPGETRASRLQPEALMPAYLYLMGPESRGVSGNVVRA